MKIPKKISAITLSLLLVGIIATTFILKNSAQADTLNLNINTNPALAKTLDDNIVKMMSAVNENEISNPNLKFSSNPYDFTKNNEYFDKIVNMGYAALPLIENYIENSPQSGLAEYLLAIAVEKIAKVDLKNDDSGNKYKWQTAKGFVPEFNKYLKSVPNSVNTILSSNKTQTEKINALKKLGTPSIPYIMDKFNSSSAEQQAVIVLTLDSLLMDDKSIKFDKNVDVKSWIENNKNKFNDFKIFIDSKSK